MNLYSALSRCTSKALRYGPCVTRGSHSFTCHLHTNHTCLYCPAARRHRPWLVLICLPTKGWPGWVDLGGWLHTQIDVPHRELNPDTVTHRSTNRARRRLTSLIETNALPLRHAATYCRPYCRHCLKQRLNPISPWLSICVSTTKCGSGVL